MVQDNSLLLFTMEIFERRRGVRDGSKLKKGEVEKEREEREERRRRFLRSDLILSCLNRPQTLEERSRSAWAGSPVAAAIHCCRCFRVLSGIQKGSCFGGFLLLNTARKMNIGAGAQWFFFFLGHQLGNTAGLLDLLLGNPGELLGTDNNGDVGEPALSEDLVDAVAEGINDEGLTLLLGSLLPGLGGHEGPDLVEVHGGGVELLLGLVEVAHTDLSEVTGVVLVEVDALVVLTTSVTATGGVLPVLA